MSLLSRKALPWRAGRVNKPNCRAIFSTPTALYSILTDKLSNFKKKWCIRMNYRDQRFFATKNSSSKYILDYWKSYGHNRQNKKVVVVGKVQSGDSFAEKISAFYAKKPWKPMVFKAFGGDKRDRTADLLNAIQALSQLSYTPIFICRSNSFVIVA